MRLFCPFQSPLGPQVCDTGECAIWDPTAERCAFLQIAKALTKLASAKASPALALGTAGRPLYEVQL